MHQQPKRKPLKIEPAEDEYSQFARLIKALERIEDGLHSIHAALTSRWDEEDRRRGL